MPLPLKLREFNVSVAAALPMTSIPPPAETIAFPALPVPPSTAPPATLTVPLEGSEPLTYSPPALILTGPLKVLAALRFQLPAPILTRLVAKFPGLLSPTTAESVPAAAPAPLPVKVSVAGAEVLAKAIAPPPPPMVAEPLALPDASSVAAPLGPTVNRRFVLVGTLPVYCSVPPSITRSAGDPAADPWPMGLGVLTFDRKPTLTTPLLIVVGVTYVLLPVRVKTPAPDSVRPPMLPPLDCNDWAIVILLPLGTMKAPPLAMFAPVSPCMKVGLLVPAMSVPPLKLKVLVPPPPWIGQPIRATPPLRLNVPVGATPPWLLASVKALFTCSVPPPMVTVPIAAAVEVVVLVMAL